MHFTAATGMCTALSQLAHRPLLATIAKVTLTASAFCSIDGQSVAIFSYKWSGSLGDGRILAGFNG